MDHDHDNAADTPGGQPPEKVEDRPNVGVVTPDDYPAGERAASTAQPPLDEDKEFERLNPGSGGEPPVVPGRPHDRDLA